MMKLTKTLWGSVGAAVALGMHFSAAAGATWERNLTYTGTDGNVFHYWKLEQKPTDGSKVPLVIFLHGAGERRNPNGSNDGSQVTINYITPLQNWLNTNETKGFLLVAGQVPYKYGDSLPAACANMTDKYEKWVYLDWTKTGHTMPEQPSTTMSLQLEFLDKLLQENTDIDTSRVYVTGMSMGGFGTWDIICRRPDVFAAALPICGGGDVNQASKIASLPIWTFHGNADGTVPVANSRDMVAALRAAGSAVKYTEYDGKDHSIWNDVYGDSAVLEWFFNQKKSGGNSEGNTGGNTGETPQPSDPVKTFTVSVQETVYLGEDGRAEPAVTVTDTEGNVLTAGTHYTVTYSDNTTAGTGKVAVTGIAPYSGTVDRTFEILTGNTGDTPSGNPGVVYAVPDSLVGSNPDGRSWGTATTYTNALKMVASEGGELWLKAGRYPLAASPDVFTSTREVRIRGGFRGNEQTLAERPSGLMTVIDGQDEFETLKVVYTATPPLFYVERMSFQRSAGKGLYADIATSIYDSDDIKDKTRVFLVDCDFSNNTSFVADQAEYGLGLYLQVAAASCVISNCTFQGNVSSATGSKYGYGAYFVGHGDQGLGRIYLEGCSFITNGCVSAAGTTSSFGAAFYNEYKAMTVRNCRFIGNRSAVNGNGGIAFFNKACPGGHALTNCVFTGNQMFRGGGTVGASSGVLVVNYNELNTKPSRPVDVANCTFAYNIAANHGTAACAATLWEGELHFINSIFYGNVINYMASGGADLSVYSSKGAISAEYCLFGVDAAPTVIDTNGRKRCRHHFREDAINNNWITLGEGNIYGVPGFVSEIDTFYALGANLQSPKPLATSNDSPGFRDAFSPALLSLNVHLRGGSGYTDEVTGERLTYPGESPALDAGNPAGDYSREARPNGRRVNMGAYGNTPYATRSRNPVCCILVR